MVPWITSCFNSESVQEPKEILPTDTDHYDKPFEPLSKLLALLTYLTMLFKLHSLIHAPFPVRVSEGSVCTRKRCARTCHNAVCPLFSSLAQQIKEQL